MGREDPQGRADRPRRGGTLAASRFLLNENVELVSMGDIFEDRLEKSLGELWTKYPGIQEKIKVTPDRHFLGFDTYTKVLMSEIDVALLAKPPGYRPMHFEAAVEARKHVFAEKPFGTDPVGVRRFMAAAKRSEELKLTVVSGAQRRAQKEYVQTMDKIRNGAIGDVVAPYAYWAGGPVLFQKERDPNWKDMTWQHRQWYSFVWLCGDQVVEQHLHKST